jgi:uncharacterized protein
LSIRGSLPVNGWPLPCGRVGRLPRTVRAVWTLCVRLCILYAVAAWDPEKAAANLRKHGVDFADAETALRDDMALTMPDDHPAEARFVTLGMDALGRLLVVVYEWRDDDVRLISARKANRSERRQYEVKR